ncbi:hypothetical protein AGMMS50268_30540 [Spirochaetia bacterium]|nr:hypothetical protein AGMMS50268_30540 [Spirochaetia bacterium]
MKTINSNAGFFKKAKIMVKNIIKSGWGGVIKLLPKRYLPWISYKIAERCGLVTQSLNLVLGKERQQFVFETERNDYVRASAVEFIANEIYDKNIEGSVAELGVHRGDFAKYINQAFPDRKFYLFDTFEGFNSSDARVDIENGYSTGNWDFTDTNVDLVLGKMVNSKMCIVKKGWFPDTTIGLNDSYAFVEIDVDLYEPMYNGLYYFYERLVKGGYMLLHDYNNDKEYRGIKAAVRKFSEEKNVPYFPLCDRWGSAIIMK